MQKGNQPGQSINWTWGSIIVGAFVAAIACGGGYDERAHEAATATAALIPDPKLCIKGVGPNKCMYVEPLDSVAAVDIDGVMAPDEFLGATEVEFANLGEPGTGRVSVAVDANQKTIRLFFKDLPLPPSSDRIFVGLDFDRLESNAPTVSAGDFGYEFNIDTQVGTKMRPTGASPGTRWVATSAGPSWQAATRNLRTLPSGHRRVDYEIIVDAASSWQTAAQRKSFGVMVGTSIRPADSGAPVAKAGSFPEIPDALDAYKLWGSVGTPFVRREKFQTVLLGRPIVAPLTYMTWNVKRMTTWMRAVEALASTIPYTPNPLVTTDITNQQIGEFIGAQDADVVGLQEVWVSDAADEIAAAANKVRDRTGLPPYSVVRGPELPPNVLTSLGGWARQNETHGGVYILSSRTVMATGTKVFDTCKGEDCFKAKGVVYARISTDPPPGPGQCGEGGVCSMPPSSDNYVDVFVTHLNSPAPFLCVPAIALLAAPLVSAPAWPVAVFALIAGADNGCFRSIAGVHHDQVASLSTYIDAVADKGRPSIVMGDFNMAGKFLTDTPYLDLIQTLKIQPQVVNPSFATPEVMLSKWPTRHPTDIDSADLAREIASAWASGVGTDIGRDWTEASSDSQRFDYIFVRSPVDRNNMQQANYRHIFLQSRNAPAWRSPWPGPIDRSSRLSDHMPILSTLVMAPAYIPGAYHPTWDQNVEFRVATYDTSGISDCWFCGQLDPYAKIKFSREQAGVSANMGGGQGNQCFDRWVGNYRADGCMANWMWKDFRPFSVTHHRTALELWDDDNTGGGGDDQYGFVNETPTNPTFELNWASGEINMLSEQGVTVASNWAKFHNVAPVQKCTRTSRANVCLQWTLTEQSPYP